MLTRLDCVPSDMQSSVIPVYRQECDQKGLLSPHPPKIRVVDESSRLGNYEELASHGLVTAKLASRGG
jgi:hypothetical protein